MLLSTLAIAHIVNGVGTRLSIFHRILHKSHLEDPISIDFGGDYSCRHLFRCAEFLEAAYSYGIDCHPVGVLGHPLEVEVDLVQMSLDGLFARCKSRRGGKGVAISLALSDEWLGGSSISISSGGKFWCAEADQGSSSCHHGEIGDDISSGCVEYRLAVINTVNIVASGTRRKHWR